MSYEDLYLLQNPIKVGAVLAMIISWSKNKSILMALVHGFFNWLYVIYYYIGKDEDEQKE
ncbi:hypothetical protein [Lutibacter sp.]